MSLLARSHAWISFGTAFFVAAVLALGVSETSAFGQPSARHKQRSHHSGATKTAAPTAKPSGHSGTKRHPRKKAQRGKRTSAKRNHSARRAKSQPKAHGRKRTPAKRKASTRPKPQSKTQRGNRPGAKKKQTRRPAGSNQRHATPNTNQKPPQARQPATPPVRRRPNPYVPSHPSCYDDLTRNERGQRLTEIGRQVQRLHALKKAGKKLHLILGRHHSEPRGYLAALPSANDQWVFADVRRPPSSPAADTVQLALNFDDPSETFDIPDNLFNEIVFDYGVFVHFRNARASVPEIHRILDKKGRLKLDLRIVNPEIVPDASVSPQIQLDAYVALLIHAGFDRFETFRNTPYPVTGYVFGWRGTDWVQMPDSNLSDYVVGIKT